MSLLDICLLAVALAMDCFALSIVGGVIVRQGVIYRQSFLFGFFQALMPLVGWFGTSYFSDYIESIDHWIAFCLLAFIGGKMIKESFDPEEEQHFNPRLLRTQLLLSVAASIDALAIGISFACTGYREVSQLTVPLLIIGIASSLFSVLGFLLGTRFGGSVTRRLKPELFGGIILVLIGVKVLISHLME